MILASLVSAFLIALSFPTAINGVVFPDLGFLSWIAWVPFLVTLSKRGFAKSGRYGFVVVGVYYLLSMYWLFFAMRNFGGLSALLSVALLVLLCAMFALYSAMVFAISGFCFRRFRLLPIFSLPFLFALAEWARERFPFHGYPWANVAYALGHDPYAMQLAEGIGVCGISFLIILVNGLIAHAWGRMRRNEARWALSFVYPVLLLLVLHGVGYARLLNLEDRLNAIVAREKPLRVALIQGNIPQSEKWDPKVADDIESLYRLFSERAFDQGADLVIWPEAAYPYTLSREGVVLPSAEAWIPQGRYVLMGALTSPDRHTKKPHIFNSALLLSDEGRMMHLIDKVHLVPFGEYVPGRDWFPFLRTIDQMVGEITPGDRMQPLETAYGKFGLLICYEDLFARHSEDLVNDGAQILVNLTNDAWYERHSAAWQHLVYSQYRAIEARRFLLRATNTGMTAIIDPLGRVEESLPWYQEGILYGDVWMIDF